MVESEAESRDPGGQAIRALPQSGDKSQLLSVSGSGCINNGEPPLLSVLCELSDGEWRPVEFSRPERRGGCNRGSWAITRRYLLSVSSLPHGRRKTDTVVEADPVAGSIKMLSRSSPVKCRGQKWIPKSSR